MSIRATTYWDMRDEGYAIDLARDARSTLEEVAEEVAKDGSWNPLVICAPDEIDEVHGWFRDNDFGGTIVIDGDEFYRVIGSDAGIEDSDPFGER